MTTPDIHQIAEAFSRRIWHDLYIRLGRLRPELAALAELNARRPEDTRTFDLKVDVQANVPAIISSNTVMGEQRHELPNGLLFLITLRVGMQRLVLVARADDEAITYTPLVGASDDAISGRRVPLVAFAPETLTEPQALVQPLQVALLGLIDAGMDELAQSA